MRRALAVLFSVLTALSACRGGAPRPLTASNEDVRSVEFTRGPASFKLLQDFPGSWRVVPPDDRVDPADAAALLDGLRRLAPGPRLSSDSAAYGLSASGATAVRAAGAANRTLFAARFGRRGPGGAVHADAGPGGDAYLVVGPPPELLARGADDWRDRRLLRGRCEAVELDAGRGWRPAPPGTAAALCALRATAILPPLPEFLAGLDRPVLRVRTAFGSFSVGALTGSERWIAVEGRPALMRAPAKPLAEAVAKASRASAE
jgi:hypothetical protein